MVSCAARPGSGSCSAARMVRTVIVCEGMAGFYCQVQIPAKSCTLREVCYNPTGRGMLAGGTQVNPVLAGVLRYTLAALDKEKQL
jgi:hypothetical protein